MSTNITTAPPLKRERRRLLKKVGELVEVRIGPGLWITMPKPKSRRGKLYVENLRAVLDQLEAIGVPASMANLRRLGAGRNSRLRAALEEIKNSAPPPVNVTPD